MLSEVYQAPHWWAEAQPGVSCLSCRPLFGCRRGRTLFVLVSERGWFFRRVRKGRLKRWSMGWKIKTWNDRDVKRLWKNGGKSIRAVRIQQKLSNEAYRDGVSSHAKIFVSLAPSPVAMILPKHPGLLVVQSRGNDIFTPSFAGVTEESRRMQAYRHFLFNFYEDVHVLIISICVHVSAGISITLH